MSLPPATVKIKRKATDDPVEFLRIHESDGKKRRGSGFVFSRQPAGNLSTASQPTSPGRRTIQQLPQYASSPALQFSGVALNSQADAPHPTSTAPTPPRVAAPRRFHISRSATPSNARPTTAGGGRKRKTDTVFVERRIRPKSADGTPGQVPSTPVEGSVPGDQNKGNAVPPEASTVQDGPTPTPEVEQPRPQKKPGDNARRPIPPVQPVPSPQLAPAPLRNVVMPSGLMMPWDASLDRLAAEMQAYTLQEIGKNIAQSEAERPRHISHRINKTPSKFKPKKPALRYLERHPEERVDEGMDVDEEYIVEELDDGEYIIDTYVRVPADALETEQDHKNIGLLILDSQPDIDEFYREEEDSDEEEDDEDEDENAENHYTADYPDEEVDSDDEYGRNAYNYRTHNASDLEEFDEDDATFSDDESTKYPWMKNRG